MRTEFIHPKGEKNEKEKKKGESKERRKGAWSKQGFGPFWLVVSRNRPRFKSTSTFIINISILHTRCLEVVLFLLLLFLDLQT